MRIICRTPRLRTAARRSPSRSWRPSWSPSRRCLRRNRGWWLIWRPTAPAAVRRLRPHRWRRLRRLRLRRRRYRRPHRNRRIRLHSSVSFAVILSKKKKRFIFVLLRNDLCFCIVYTYFVKHFKRASYFVILCYFLCINIYISQRALVTILLCLFSLVLCHLLPEPFVQNTLRPSLVKDDFRYYLYCREIVCT
jgi:hypothetical protein